jgi:hypothetical protein
MSGAIEISPHDADTIYLAATRYKLADYKPYLFRSTDGGRTFQSINGDFPGSEITRVVRADPARKGLLFVGTETGVYYSLNDGQSWMRMGGGLPVVPVYDLKIKGTDLVVGTHGRSFWILDDITPLRGLVDDSHGSRLFEPRTTVRTKLHFGALRSLRPLIERFVEQREAVAEGQEERLKTVEAEIDSLLREKEEIEKWAAVGSA